jgi:hypothetical protein
MRMASRKTTCTRRGGEAAARTQRALQDEIEPRTPRQPKGSDDEEAEARVQAGCAQATDEAPGQHLTKPGNEHELATRAAFPRARLHRQRQARRHGGDHHRRRLRHRRAVAVLFAREGADVAIVYLSNTRTPRKRNSCVEKEGRAAC